MFAFFVVGRVVMERIAETLYGPLKGDYPKDIPTYPSVDTELLYEGDDKPFHVVLPIAEVGRISENGLLYDEALVNAIAEQLPGSGGIRGHIPSDQISSAFPVDAVHWIGHVIQENVLWGKGYIPPGETREDVRRRKARGGNLGTSIFGDAIKETTDKTNKRGNKVWRARNFQLETLDLAHDKRASLRQKRGFAIVGETEGYPQMENMTVADVPQNIREQIIRGYETEEKAQRVAELEQKLQTAEERVKVAEAQVAEAASWKSIVAEIRSTIGKDTDTVQIIAEYHNQITKLAEMLGVPFSNITVKVEEMHEQVAEMKEAAFEGAVVAEVEKRTAWKVNNPKVQEQVKAFRNSFKKAILAEMGDERATERIAETATGLWDSEYSLIAQGLLTTLGGPAAAIGGKSPAIEQRVDLDVPETRTAVKAKFGL